LVLTLYSNQEMTINT